MCFLPAILGVAQNVRAPIPSYSMALNPAPEPHPSGLYVATDFDALLLVQNTCAV
jgi:hypothetical protein